MLAVHGFVAKAVIDFLGVQPGLLSARINKEPEVACSCRCLVLVARYWLLDAGCLLLEAEFRILVAGFNPVGKKSNPIGVKLNPTG